MAFCTKCGKELNEGDRFCFHCGEPIPDVKRDREKPQPSVIKPEEESSETKDTLLKTQEKTTVGIEVQQEEEIRADVRENPDKVTGGKAKWNKKKTAAIAAAGIFVVLAVILFIAVQPKEKSPEPKKDDTNYVNYANNTVCFSVDYPEGYQVTEPNNNNVLITYGENVDFQVSIEYAYHTASNSAIYSAKDFASQIDADAKVLTDWIGSSDVQITNKAKSRIAGRSCYEYSFDLQVNNSPHTGKLYICDGDGEFGCYSYLCAYNKNSENAELYKMQCEAMEKSFEITDACQAEGYKIYHYDEFDMQFMVRDEAMGKTKSSNGMVVVYPVEGVFTEANIWIKKSTYNPEEKSVEDVLESSCQYYFKYHDQAQYLSQMTELDYGRYPFSGIDMQFYDKGEKYTTSIFAFVKDGVYWTITMKSTDEYYNTAATAVSDILFSMKIGEDLTNNADADVADPDTEAVSDTTEGKAESMKRVLSDLISQIKKQEGFVENSSWKPLAVLDDFNGDNNKELLVVYELKNGNGWPDVMYELWNVSETKAVKVKSEILFAEVGGNSGEVGIVKSEGKNYLAVVRHEPEGDTFNDSCIYFPFTSGAGLLGEECVYMERHGNFGEEDKGRYILGDTKVEQKEYDARALDFSNWLYRLDIFKGDENGNVMTFDDLLSR